MLKIDHLNLQNRKIFFGLAFGAARLRSPGVQNRPLRARNRKIFFGLAPALRACARRPRAGATDGWRGGPTPQSVRAECAKEGHFIQHLLTRRIWVRISFVGSLNTISGQFIAFAWRDQLHPELPRRVAVLLELILLESRGDVRRVECRVFRQVRLTERVPDTVL